MVLLLAMFSSIVLCQDTITRRMEFGVDEGVAVAKTLGSSARLDRQIGLRVGHISSKHSFGSELRLTISDPRLNGADPTLSAGVNVIVPHRPAFAGSVSSYATAGLLVSSATVAETSTMLLPSANVGIGSWFMFGAHALRTEAAIQFERGRSSKADNLKVRDRLVIGLKIGYSLFR